MKVFTYFVAFALLALSGTIASAASCDAAASRLASSKGASILSVSSSGNKCIIKLLIKPASGPPKRQTFVVSK